MESKDSDSRLVSSLENDLEYVGRRVSTNVDVPGNIPKKKYFQFWEELKAPDCVLKTLVEGYELFVHTLPPPSFEKTMLVLFVTWNL